jgi:hypothetical protein
VVLGATLANRKRWLTSYSITLELLAPDARALESGSRFIYFRAIEAGHRPARDLGGDAAPPRPVASRRGAHHHPPSRSACS